jgi:Leucine-rich repeat (LRR) protein
MPLQSLTDEFIGGILLSYGPYLQALNLARNGEGGPLNEPCNGAYTVLNGACVMLELSEVTKLGRLRCLISLDLSDNLLCDVSSLRTLDSLQELSLSRNRM